MYVLVFEMCRQGALDQLQQGYECRHDAAPPCANHHRHCPVRLWCSLNVLFFHLFGSDVFLFYLFFVDTLSKTGAWSCPLKPVLCLAQSCEVVEVEGESVTFRM